MAKELYYNVTGQTFWFDAPEGRPSSVTSVAVYPSTTGDDGTAETATTGSASVETNPNTTFDAASGAGQANPRTLNLTATTGVTVGRRYLATNSTGETEWVEISEVTSGASATSRHPLQNAYASSDSFEGTRISISVLDAWIQDINNISDDLDPNPGYRVRWVYVYNSTTYVHDDYWDVVRYKSEHGVKPVDVDRLSPGWLESLPTRYREDRGRALIDEAYLQVGLDLHESGLADEMARNDLVIASLVKYRALYQTEIMRVLNGSGSDLALDVAKSQYEQRLNKLIRVDNKTDFDSGTDGAGGHVDTKSLWER